MTVVERLHGDAMKHLSEARRAMKRLSGCTADWTAGTLVEIEFDSLEERCREFARCQFGFRVPSTPQNAGK